MQDTPIEKMLAEIERLLGYREESLRRHAGYVKQKVAEMESALDQDLHVNGLGIIQGLEIDRLAGERELLVELRNVARYLAEKEKEVVS